MEEAARLGADRRAEEEDHLSPLPQMLRVAPLCINQAIHPVLHLLGGGLKKL